MRILPLLFQFIFARTTPSCVALQLKCTGSTFSARFNGGCIPRHPTGLLPELKINDVCTLAIRRLTIREGECGNTAENQENGGLQWTNRVSNEFLGIDQTMTCRQGPDDGVFAPYVESQTREYGWNSVLRKFELINAYAIY